MVKLNARIARGNSYSNEKAPRLYPVITDKKRFYTCQRCGRKQSKAKGREIAVEVHHISGETRMKEIEDVIRLHLLCDPDLLETVCVDCHNKEHER